MPSIRVHRSGYYAWLEKPLSGKTIENRRLLSKIRKSYLASGGIYGSPRIYRDLREVGELCGENRVARLMHRTGLPPTVAPNLLKQRFDVAKQDYTWSTDITYIRTHEGWLYLAVVVDLYSRMVIG